MFQKFDDEENVEMNFKKLLLKRCYKHLNESDEVTQTSLTDEDKEEVAYKRKVRAFGNIRLIADLFTRGYVPDDIIENTLALNSDVNDDSVQKMCIFMTKIGEYVIKNPSSGTITREYFTEKVDEMLLLREDDRISS